MKNKTVLNECGHVFNFSFKQTLFSDWVPDRLSAQKKYFSSMRDAEATKDREYGGGPMVARRQPLRR